jgi:hypothetical protein
MPLPGWSTLAGALGSILDKLIPGRMEQYANDLKQLEFEYAKALHEGRDTDAATALKRMQILRRKLGIANE